MRAGALHRPGQPRARRVVLRPGQQHPAAAILRRDGDHRELAAQPVQQAGGMRVGVRVHADDGIGSVCEHGHSGRPFIQVRSADGIGLDATPGGTSVTGHAPATRTGF
jgi:hypothetical protein